MAAKKKTVAKKEVLHDYVVSGLTPTVVTESDSESNGSLRVNINVMQQPSELHALQVFRNMGVIVISEGVYLNALACSLYYVELIEPTKKAPKKTGKKTSKKKGVKKAKK